MVEALGKDGELFGFDRCKTLRLISAEQIAHAAQVFGHEDDITVLRLVRIASPEQVTDRLNNGLSHDSA